MLQAETLRVDVGANACGTRMGVTDAVDDGHYGDDAYAAYGGVAPYYAQVTGENGNEIVLDLSPTRHLLFALVAIFL